MQNQLKLFAETLPKRPYCSDALEQGLVIRNIPNALKMRYIQPNNPNSKLWLVYDIDRPTSPDEITDDLGLPAPHIFVQNVKNQHAHAFYGLEVPVHLNSDSSQKAIRFAGALDVAFTAKILGDASYSGLIAKNPLHSDWRTWYCNVERYQLTEIAEYLDLTKYNDRRRALPDVGLGRNCTIFENLREWSYKSIRQGWPEWHQWLNACSDRALMYNANFRSPLIGSEVYQIAKSVAKWTYQHFDPSSFSRWQASQGAKGGKAKGKAYQDKRAQAIQMASEGIPIQDIAARLSIHRNSVRNYLMHK